MNENMEINMEDNAIDLADILGFNTETEELEGGTLLSEEEQRQLESIVDQTITRMEKNIGPVDESVSRFKSADWFEMMQRKTVTIAGVGGIGSYTAFLVGRLKPSRIYIYDPDNVEAVNMSGQLYSESDIGMSKVYAMNRMLNGYCGYSNSVCIHEEFTEYSAASEILICGFDNMDARRKAFCNWKKTVESIPEEERKNALFIDGRLAAEEFQVFCMTGEDAYLHEMYMKEWLFRDNEAELTLCSYKQTSFCANMIGSVITNLLVNFISNLCDPVIKRELPFKTFYDASLMRFVTE